MVTIDEIAKRAGVAKSTVSRYLNNGSVSEKTATKIKSIIEELDYTPNLFARSLKAQRSAVLGVIIPRLNSPSTNEVLAGIDEAAYQLGYQLNIMNSSQSNSRELANVQSLLSQKVDGILLLARQISSPAIELLKQSEVPVLILGQTIEHLDSTTHDDYQAGVMMGEYALSLGHKQFLFVGVSEQDYAVGKLRKAGFIDTISKANDVSLHTIETSFSKRKVYEDALTFLPSIETTYIACATDNIALVIMKAARELNIVIPEEVSISGFGGYDMTRYMNPLLTTVIYPYKQFGYQSARQLIAMIEQTLYSTTPLCYELLKGNSTQIYECFL